MLRIVAAFHDNIFSDPDSPTGLNKNIDFRSVTLAYDENLTRYHEEWTKRFEEGSDPNDRCSAFRCTLLPFLTNYQRLVMYSFGFQQAYHRGFQPGDEIFFTKCLEAAKAVINNFIEVLAPSGYMRYSADGHFVFSSFASAFLLKLLRPEFSSLMTKKLEIEIFDLIGRLIQTFSSPEIAIDDRHTPKLYARFLAGLLSRNRKDGATVGRLHPQLPPQSEVAHAASGSYTSHISTASTPSFSVTPAEGDRRGGHDTGFTHVAFNPTIEKTYTPIYRPEATYTLGTAPIELGSSVDMGALSSLMNGFSDEEMLATMQALKNPQWWSTMMMPGFSWPQDSPLLNGLQVNTMDSIYSQNVHGLHHQGFGAYQPTEVPLS